MNIKKKLKIIIPVIIAAIGGILIAIGFIKGAAKDYKNTLELQDFEATLSSGNIYNLDVNVTLANLNVISSNDVDDIEITANGVTKKFIEYSTTNNTLRLRYNTKSWHQAIFIPGYLKKMGSIDIYIPADMQLKEVKLEAEYGDLNVKYITADKIYIECGRNNNYIENIKCNYTEINNKDGKVDGESISAENADLNVNGKKAVFSDFVTSSLIVKNDGDLKLSGKINGDSSIKSDSGNVDVIIYGKKSDYSFEALGGKIKIDGEKPQLDEDAEYTFKLMGDMSISIK